MSEVTYYEGQLVWCIAEERDVRTGDWFTVQRPGIFIQYTSKTYCDVVCLTPYNPNGRCIIRVAIDSLRVRENVIPQVQYFTPKESDADAYQTFTSQHRPELDDSTPYLLYLSTCLGEEAGEVAGLVKRVYRDHHGRITPERKDAFKLELGDVLWNVAQIAWYCDLSLSDIMTAHKQKLEDRTSRDAWAGSGDHR